MKRRADTPPVMYLTPPTAVLPDRDRDGVPDFLDCQPSNPLEHGFWGDVYRRVTSTARAALSRSPIRAPSMRAARTWQTRATQARTPRRAGRRPTSTGRSTIIHTRGVSKTASGRIYMSQVGSRVAPAPQPRTVTIPARRAVSPVTTQRAALAKQPIPPAGGVFGRLHRFFSPLTRPAATAVGAVIARTGIDYRRAERRRTRVLEAGWGAPKQALTEISRIGAPFRARMERRIEATTAREQAKFPEGTLSGLTTGFAKQTARVAHVARGFEKPVERRMQAAEKFMGLQSERIPEPLRWAGGQAKRVGYGIAFTGPAGAVEMAGMVPQAAETMARRPEIIPAAVGVGLVTMGKGMYHGATTDPARMAGEFIAFGAITKGAGTAARPFTPTIVRGTGGYTGIGIKGFAKPVFKTVKVPAIQRGGVFEAALLRKPPTIPKQIKTGYIREPIPIIGIRTKAGIPAVEGVTATYRGLQIGRRWTPAEYYKASKVDVTPTLEGTIFEARRGTQVRIGKLRYEKESIARGMEEGGYFLPEAKAPIKPAFPELTTAERGIIPLEPAKFPLSTEVIAPKPLKPTWVYGEVQRPYLKAGDISLAGSKARMRWIEMGQRRLIYGIEGAPKQPKLIIKADRWGYHPTYPPGIAAGKAVTPPLFEGYAPPKQIPSGIYFKTTAVAPSSRFFDWGHLLRPTRAKPAPAPPPVTPTARGIGAVTPRGVPERIIPAPIRTRPTPEPLPQAARVTYAEPAPTVCVGGVCFRDVGIPQPQRISPTVPRAAPKVTYAEPPKPHPTVEDILGRVKPAPYRKPTAISKTKPSPKADTRRRVLWTPFRPPSPEDADATAPFITPSMVITPIPTPSEKKKDDPSKKEDDWRKIMPVHIPKPKDITKLITEPSPVPDPIYIPEPVPDPYPEKIPPPVPEPEGWKVPPPPIIPTLPKIPIIPFIPIGEDKKKRRRKPRGKRDLFAWEVKNPIRAFFGEDARAGKDLKSIIGR